MSTLNLIQDNLNGGYRFNFYIEFNGIHLWVYVHIYLFIYLLMFEFVYVEATKNKLYGE